MKKSLGAKPLIFPAPVFAIGSYNKEGKPNIMIAAWAGLCSSDPPSVAVSLRKATYTYGNIVERKAFTVNIPQDSMLRQVDYIGLCSGRDRDKFADTGLTPLGSETVDAPYVKEFPVVLECRLIKTVEVGLHTQFIGEILDVKADEAMLNEKDFLDMGKIRPILFSPGSRMYYEVGAEIGKAFSIGKDLKQE